MPIKIYLFFLIVFLTVPNLVFAENYDQLGTEIQEYNQKIDNLINLKDSLNIQIKILDLKIAQTQLQIKQATLNANTLKSEISSIDIKIDGLDSSLTKLSEIYAKEIKQNYKLQRKVPLYTLIVSDNFNQFFESYKYLSNIQKNNRQTFKEMEATRVSLDLQKQIKFQKQNELQKIESELSQQQSNLSNQKNSKTGLLEITKNDELRYQKLKEAAEEELNSLIEATLAYKRAVKKGDLIGLMGNTGYSFGDHLHFGLYNLTEDKLDLWEYTNDIDASDYLNQHRWPLNNLNSINRLCDDSIRDNNCLTQLRGDTKYSSLYSDHFHHGLDIVSTDTRVFAVDDGVAYTYRNTKSSLGNHVKIFHTDGKMTLYLHLQ